MEGKAWVGGGRLAENDPNQSACLWEGNKNRALFMSATAPQGPFPLQQEEGMKEGKEYRNIWGIMHCENCFSDRLAPIHTKCQRQAVYLLFICLADPGGWGGGGVVTEPSN